MLNEGIDEDMVSLILTKNEQWLKLSIYFSVWNWFSQSNWGNFILSVLINDLASKDHDIVWLVCSM